MGVFWMAVLCSCRSAVKLQIDDMPQSVIDRGGGDAEIGFLTGMIRRVRASELH
jgi:hypothetical protein